MLENNLLFSLVCLSFYFLYFLAIKDIMGKAGIFFFCLFLNNNIAKGPRRQFWRHSPHPEIKKCVKRCRFSSRRGITVHKHGSAKTQRRSKQTVAPLRRNAGFFYWPFIYLNTWSGITVFPTGEGHTSRVSEQRLKHYPGRARGTWRAAPHGRSQGDTALHVYCFGVADASKVFWSGLWPFRGEHLISCLIRAESWVTKQRAEYHDLRPKAFKARQSFTTGGSDQASDVAAAFNLDQPVTREEVMYAKGTNRIIFHLYISKKHLVQKQTCRSRK